MNDPRVKYRDFLFPTRFARQAGFVSTKVQFNQPTKEVGMIGREVVRMAMELQDPPRVPVTVIGGGACYVHMLGKTFAEIKDDPRKIAEVFIQAYRRIGHDLLWTGSNFINYPIHFLGCPIQDDSADNPALVGTVIESLEQRHDLDMDKVLKNPVMQSIIDSHHLVADEIGRETMLIPTLWGPLSAAGRIMGTEQMMLALLDDPQGLLELINFAAELTWSLAERIMDHPDIRGVNLSEPLASGDLISPEYFREFAKPFLKALAGRITARDKYSMIHVCGDTTRILEDIVDIGPHCFSLESKVDLRTAKSILGGHVCVAGNVSPTGAFLSGKPAEVIAEAKTCIEAWGDGGGYILTLGCDFPRSVPLENIMALMSLKAA
jgi:uroporphyrinogen decarboxylase